MITVITKEGEPIPNTTLDPPKTRLGNGYKIEFHRWGTDRVLLRSLQERAALLNERVFRLNPLQTADEIYHHMRWDPSYEGSITYVTHQGKDIAFCIQEYRKFPLPNGNTESMVWTHLRAVDKRHQAKGVGTALLRKGCEEYASYDPHFYGGRTQSELVYLSLYSSDSYREVLAIDRDFRGSERQVVKFAADQAIYPHPVDTRTGLIQGAYPEGETGGYTLDLSHPRVRKIHDRLEELGGRGNLEENKRRGDAFIYLAIPKRDLNIA